MNKRNVSTLMVAALLLSVSVRAVGLLEDTKKPVLPGTSERSVEVCNGDNCPHEPRDPKERN